MPWRYGEHHSSHIATSESPLNVEWHLHMSHALHLHSRQWLPFCFGAQKSSQRSSSESHTPIGASDLHVAAPPSATGCVHSLHRLHLQSLQCDSANSAEQKSSHCSWFESSFWPELHARPFLQKPHALHLQRPQWSSKNCSLHHGWHSSCVASSS